jgi:hypothetical protein
MMDWETVHRLLREMTGARGCKSQATYGSMNECSQSITSNRVSGSPTNECSLSTTSRRAGAKGSPSRGHNPASGVGIEE